ncbi:hypothetical protein [Bradyrhizobium sp. USDA 3315]
MTAIKDFVDHILRPRPPRRGRSWPAASVTNYGYRGDDEAPDEFASIKREIEERRAWLDKMAAMVRKAPAPRPGPGL